MYNRPILPYRLSLIALVLTIMFLSCSKSSEPEEPSNRPPAVPAIDTASVCPPDQSTGRSLTPMLAWVCSDPDGDSLIFDVYFGPATDSVPPLVSDSQTARSYPLDTLEYEMMYHWQIVAHDLHGLSSTSPLWCFTTRVYQDTTPPEISIVFPPADTTVKGTIEILAEATDNDGISAVEFFVDGASHFVDVSSPYSYQWNTTGYIDSTYHDIFAIAVDAAGNVDTSETVTVLVAHDLIPPEVAVVFPHPGDMVSDTVDIIVEATDNDTVYAVEIFIDDLKVATDTAFPYVYHWSTAACADSSQHSIKASAFDGVGNRTDAEAVTVMVYNNNLYPETILSGPDYHINAVDENSIFPGVVYSWSGSDPDGSGSLSEFEWRLYGPFEDTITLYTTEILENCFYDAAGDSFICDTGIILWLDSLPDAVDGLPQIFARSQGPNFDSDPTDVWVTDQDVIIYDVFKDLNLTATSQFKFVFWIRTRDSNGLPDQSPAFKQAMVYEAKYERDIAVLDETGYTISQGRWSPRDLDTSKAVLRDFIREAGYTEFDTLSGHDYFFTTSRKNLASTPVTPHPPEFSDILSHRMLIFFKDDAVGPNESVFGLMQYVFFGLDAGLSAWVLSRNLGRAGQDDTSGTILDKSESFRYYFGIENVVCEGWMSDLFFLDPSEPVFNEQFVGAYSANPSYPHIDLDSGLLDSRYPRWLIDTSHVMQGLPEVGAAIKSASAAPLYLYLSRHEDSSDFHGQVCAVTQERDDMRTACWLFTPLAMDPTAMQTGFNTTLSWLENDLKSASPVGSNDRRDRIRTFLNYLTVYADEEELKNLGMSIKPFVHVPMK